MKLIILLASSALLLLSCNMGSSFGDEFSVEDGKEILKKAKFDRVLIDSTAEMQVFASMNKTDKLNKDADIQFLDSFKDLYLIVIKEPISGFDLALAMNRAKYTSHITDSSSSFSIYGEYITKRIVGNMSKGSDSLVSKRTIHNMPLSVYYIEGELDKTKLFYQIGFIQGKEQFYQVITWTVATRKNLYEGVMRKMIESLEEY